MSLFPIVHNLGIDFPVWGYLKEKAKLDIFSLHDSSKQGVKCLCHSLAPCVLSSSFLALAKFSISPAVG